jgi:hypothetical protein
MFDRVSWITLSLTLFKSIMKDEFETNMFSLAVTAYQSSREKVYLGISPPKNQHIEKKEQKR